MPHIRLAALNAIWLFVCGKSDPCGLEKQGDSNHTFAVKHMPQGMLRQCKRCGELMVSYCTLWDRVFWRTCRHRTGVVFIGAALLLVLPRDAAAEDETQAYIICASEKQVANAMVRQCPDASKTVLETLFAMWKKQGVYDQTVAALEQQGLALSDAHVNPYLCVVPKAFLDAPPNTQRAVNKEIARRMVDTLQAHGLPGHAEESLIFNAQRACRAVQIAVEKPTPLVTHLAEYGIE